MFVKLNSKTNSMIWLNNHLLTEDEAQLPATSAGTLLGWGVFTTVGIWNAHPFALDLHLQRLRHDAQRAHIEYSMPDETLREAVQNVIAANTIERGILRLTLTKRGDNRWNMAEESDLSVMAQKVSSTGNDGLRVALSPFRVHSQRATTGIKTTSYLDHQMAWADAQSRGFDEAILLNERDEICEGARSNVFWTRDGVLFTPSLESGCLPGIARGLVLDWARQMQISIREERFDVADILAPDELFLTSAATGVRAVGEFFDDESQSHFGAGRMTLQLQACWQEESEKAEISE